MGMSPVSACVCASSPQERVRIFCALAQGWTSSSCQGIHPLISSPLGLQSFISLTDSFSFRSSNGGTIRVYRFEDGGRKLVLEHSTPTEDVPTAMASFQGKLLVGMGTSLRIYEMGKKKLLKKSENKNFYRMITQLYVDGSRIVVGDVSESFIFCKFRRVSAERARRKRYL